MILTSSWRKRKNAEDSLFNAIEASEEVAEEQEVTEAAEEQKADKPAQNSEAGDGEKAAEGEGSEPAEPEPEMDGGVE